MVNRNEIEEKVRKMFPIGTKFFPAHLNTKNNKDKFLIVTTDNLIWIDDCLITTTKNGKMYSYEYNLGEGNCEYNRILCRNGKFATVLENINKQEIYELW